MGTGKDLWNQWEWLYNQQDVAGVASLFTRDGVYSAPSFRLDGREAIAIFLNEEAKAISDLNMETSLIMEAGDTVMSEWTYRSTQTGALIRPDGKKMPLTGKPLHLAGVTVGTVKDGKFASVRAYYHLRKE